MITQLKDQLSTSQEHISHLTKKISEATEWQAMKLQEKDEEADFVREQARKHVEFIMKQQKDQQKTFVDNLRLQDISLNWQIEQQLNTSRSVVQHNKEGKENRKAASTNRASKLSLANTVEPTKDYKLYGQLKFVQAQQK